MRFSLPFHSKKIRRVVSIMLALFVFQAILLFALRPTPADAAWYNSTWSFRKLLMIQESKVSGTSNLTNFPVLVRITDPNLKAGAQSDGDDILFTSGDGTTKLDHDIERYNSSTGELIAWVEIPTLDYNDNTPIYLYYGNAASASQQNASGTWENNYKGVWHLADGSGTTADDETTNANDLTLNTASWLPSAKLDGGWNGDGSNRIEQGSDDSDFDFAASDNFTISYWFKSDSTTNPATQEYVISKGGNSNIGYFTRLNTSGELIFGTEYTGDGSVDDTADSNADVYDGQWHHAVVVKVGTSSMSVFIDGVLSESDNTITNSSIETTEVLRIGDLNSTDTTNEFNGDVDEVRVARTNRSADWIATEYNNQADPVSFFTKGTQQTQREPSLYWSFDEGSGATANDSTSSDNDGSISGATWQTKEACLSDGCLKFDGSNDYVRKTYAGDTELDVGTASFSVGAWFRHPGTISGTDTIISRVDGVNGVGYKLYYDATNGVCFGIDASAGSFPSDSACTTTSHADNKWHYIEGVKNGTSSITLYIDGNQVAQDSSITASAISGTNAPFYVGLDADGSSNPWDGFIDEVKSFDHARTAAQISADFSSRGSSTGAAATLGTNDTAYLSNGLVGYWKMDESDWTNNCSTDAALDASGNANNADSCPSTTGPDPAAGKFGNAGDFDGSDDYLDAGDPSSLTITSSVSVSAWIKRNSLTSTTRFLVVKGNRHSSTNNYALWIDSTDRPQFTVTNDGSTTVSAQATSGITDTNWHLLTGTFTPGKSVKIYVDGQLVTTTTANVPQTLYTSANSLRIGANGTGTERFSGNIDDVRIYSRTLSDQEASSLYDWAPGPKGYWKFDEGTGTTSVSDASGNAYTGTMNTFPAEAWKSGKFGRGLDFDGSSDYISLPSGVNIVEQDFTVSAWIYPHSVAPSQTAAIYSQKTTSDDNPQIYLQISNSGQLSCAVRDSSANSANAQSSASALTANVWSYVTCRRTGDTVEAYINGVLKTTDTNASLGSPSGNNWAIGAAYDDGSSIQDYFDGLVDDVKLYNYARTPKQIVSDMNAGHPSVGSPVSSPVAYWKMDEGYGTTSSDSTPNDNDLTLDIASWATAGKFNKSWNGTGGSNVRMQRSDDSDFDFTASEDFSVSLWFKSDTTSNPGASRYFLGKRNGTGYAIYTTTDGIIRFGIDSDGSWSPADSVASASDIYDGNWHHIVGVKTGTAKIELYVDGKLAQTDSAIAASGSLANDGALIIGDADTSSGGEIDSDLDEVKIYRYALNSDEVKVDYNRGSSIVVGAASTDSSGNPSQSGDRRYCVPGDTGSCSTPVAEWKFEEATGTTVNDASGNANTGTLSGPVTWSSGKLGRGLGYPGSGGGEVNAGSASVLDDLSAMTLAAWIYPKSVGEASDGRIATKAAAGPANGWWFITTGSSAIGFRSDHGTQDLARISAASSITLNQWNFVQVTWDGSSTAANVHIYVNGREVSYATTTDGTGGKNSDASSNFFIGNSATGNRSFDGTIDNLTVYNYVRTPAQLAWDYNKGGPLAHWKFNECQGTTAYDATGNGYNGTITPGGSGNTSAGTCNSGTTTEMWNDGTTGKFQGSLGFDGSDDYVDVGDRDFTSDITIAAWVNPNSITTRDGIISKRTASENSGNWSLRMDSSAASGKLEWQVWSSVDNGHSVTSTGALTTGTWYHVIVSFESSTNTTKLYINGRLDKTDTSVTDNLANNAETIKIGFDGQSDYFDTLIDDVKLYNYIITPDQAKTIYNQGAAVHF